MNQLKLLGVKRSLLEDRISLDEEEDGFAERLPQYSKELEDLAKEFDLVANNPHAGRATARIAHQSSLAASGKRELLIELYAEQPSASTNHPQCMFFFFFFFFSFFCTLL